MNPVLNDNIPTYSDIHLRLTNPTTHQYDSSHLTFQQILNHINKPQIDAQEKMQALELGHDNMIDTVMAIQKANQTLHMMIQVRNRLVDGYQEVFSQQI